MTDKHELDINEEVTETEATEEAVEETVTEAVEETAEETATEMVEETAEEVNEEAEAEETESAEEVAEDAPSEEEPVDVEAIKEEIISEFAPEPIKIPNYNKEKEKRKVEKAKAKRKKLKSKKARRRRKRIRKILIVSRNILFTLLMVAVVATTLFSLMIRMNTSEYSVEKAIRDSNPETYEIGKINNPETFFVEPSSPRASLVDLLKDNAIRPVTYAEIESHVDRSSYPTFVSGVAHDAINFLVYGEPFAKVTKADILNLLSENKGEISYILYGTKDDYSLSDTICEELAGKIIESDVIKELTAENLSKQPVAKTTRLTAMLFSTVVLILLVVVFIVLLVLTVIYCKGYWHMIIGGAITLAGILAGVAGYFFRINFSTDKLFIKSMIDAVVKNFNNSAIVFAAVTVLVGVLVLLIGKTVSDDEPDAE